MKKKGRKSKNKLKRSCSNARSPRDLIVNHLQCTAILYESQNWKEIVALEESLDTEIRKVFDGAIAFLYHYSAYYLKVAVSYVELDETKKAIEYFEKTIKTTKKSISEKRDLCAAHELRQQCEAFLLECYTAERRYYEATGLLLKVYDPESLHIPRHLALVVDFLSCLQTEGEHELALSIGEQYIKEQNRCCQEGIASSINFQLLRVMGRCHQEQNDFNASIATFQDILKKFLGEIRGVWTKSHLFSNLALSYSCLGDIENAELYLDQVMPHLLNEPDTTRPHLIPSIVQNVADTYFHLEGREKEAIKYYERSLELMEEEQVLPSHFQKLTYSCPEKSRGTAFRKLGLLYLRLKEWDNAITSLKHSICILSYSQVEKVRESELRASYQELGRVFLEQFLSEPHNPEKREDVLDQALQYSQEASKLVVGESSSTDHGVYLDLAHETFFLGDRHRAHDMLILYLDNVLVAGPSFCHTCHQSSPKDGSVQVCRGCKVVSFCSCQHQAKDWNNKRTSHKQICGLLKTWRHVKKGKCSIKSSAKIFDNYFEFLSKEINIFSHSVLNDPFLAKVKMHETHNQMCLACND